MMGRFSPQGREKTIHFPNASYSASQTGSHHSVAQPSPGSSKAMWLNQLSAAAPCQCFTPAGMVTTLPGASGWARLPSS